MTLAAIIIDVARRKAIEKTGTADHETVSIILAGMVADLLPRVSAGFSHFPPPSPVKISPRNLRSLEE